MSLLSDVIKRGTRAAQAAATAVATGTLYYVTDEELLERSSGSAWEAMSGGGGKWTLITTRTVGSGATEDFTGLGSYNEILVVVRSVTTGSSAIIQCLVSTDGGSTFLNASGDYLSMPQTGIPVNDTTMPMHNTSATAARTTWRTITNFNKTVAKVSNLGIGVADNASYFIPTASALNAIRIRPHTGNFNGAGTIYVYGRGI